VSMLDDLTNFFRLLSGLVDGFRQRAAEIESLLRDPTTAFLLVSLPEPDPVEEAVFLGSELTRLGMRGSALVVNRVHPLDRTGLDTAGTTARLEPALGPALAARVASKHAQLQHLARREQVSVERLAAGLGEPPTFCLLDRGADVHDIPGLASLQAELFSR
jgi:anion-transporting  ArsA/GET3 family ATPase